MWPALDPAGHRVPRAETTCLPTPQRPIRKSPFVPGLHLHQRKSSYNLHLQYSTNTQSTPSCQWHITARSDHPPVLGCSGHQSPPWWVHWQHTQSNQFREKRKRKEMNENIKQVIESQTKAKTRSLEREKSRSPKARAAARHNRDKMLQNFLLLKVRQMGLTPSANEHN
jgi:hypothetical protein